MTDKVQKIREEVEKLKDQLVRGACASQKMMETNCKEEAYNEMLPILDSLQEEPVSEEFEEALAREWQGYNDRGAATVDALEDNTQELAFAKGFYRGWNYPKQLPASENFEKTFISMVNATHENNGSYSLHEYAQRLYNIAKDTLRKPISEDLEEAAKYCIPDESYHMTIESKEEGSNENVYDYVQMLDMFKAGANWQKEQMVKNSIECIVYIDAGGYPYIGVELYDYKNDKPLAKLGDKVKVIINN